MINQMKKAVLIDIIARSPEETNGVLRFEKKTLPFKLGKDNRISVLHFPFKSQDFQVYSLDLFSEKFQKEVIDSRLLPAYIYRCRVVSVYDGDTIRIDWDLGGKVKMTNEPFRLYGLDAPEVRGAEREKGIVSRDMLRTLILDQELIVKTFKDKKGKYGRYLGIFFKDGVNVNEWMIRENLAERNYYD